MVRSNTYYMVRNIVRGAFWFTVVLAAYVFLHVITLSVIATGVSLAATLIGIGMYDRKVLRESKQL